MSDRVPLLTEGGITHEWEDNKDGTYTVHSSQDVEGILDRNKAMANYNDGYNASRDMRRIASIPTIVLMQWLNELMGRDGKAMTQAQAMQVLNSHEFIKKKLDDPNWAYLRSVHFKMGM